MKYDITKQASPKMPTLGKSVDCIKTLLSQASKDMKEPLVPMFFPVLGAHVSGAEFLYPDNSWKELCGQMANLVADSGCNKGQLSLLVNAICRDFRQHDDEQLKKLVEWSKLVKSKGANKEKPLRPAVAFYWPPADTTAPAFIQNACALEELGGRTQMFDFPEIEMANKLCGSHRQVSQMLRNIYDRARAGALRATADGVTGNPVLRTCITISSTPYATRNFYKSELFNGTFGRMVFSFKARTNRDGRIPKVGKFNDEFYQKLDEYLLRLDNCKGRFIIRPLNKLIEQMAQDMASIADLADDDILWDISKRALVSAWKAGCVMWIMNNQVWTKAIGELVEWLAYHDIWSKLQIFGDMLTAGDGSSQETTKKGPKNMLDDLSDSFNEAQLQALRTSLGKDVEGTKRQLNVWKTRGFIEYSAQTGLYSKTQEYLGSRVPGKVPVKS